MKELFRLTQHQLPDSYDLWIISKKPFGRGDSQQVKMLYDRALARIVSP